MNEPDWMMLAQGGEPYSRIIQSFRLWRGLIIDPKHRYADQVPDTFWLFSSAYVER